MVTRAPQICWTSWSGSDNNQQQRNNQPNTRSRIQRKNTENIYQEELPDYTFISSIKFWKMKVVAVLGQQFVLQKFGENDKTVDSTSETLS